MKKHPVEQIAENCGGTIKEVGLLPGGGGFATMSMPLRKDHWLYQKDETVAGPFNVPPMVFRMGEDEKIAVIVGPVDGLGDIYKGGVLPQKGDRVALLSRDQMANAIRAAGKYAVRCATMNGAEDDFDPDALLQNLVVGFLGYWTKDGLTGDSEDAKWCDPQKPFEFQ